jgi:D-isomer specific 2-hydroxyacid dehydrogenase, NAD binding domain
MCAQTQFALLKARIHPQEFYPDYPDEASISVQFEHVFSWTELDRMLGECDIVVLSCALTPETTGLIDGHRLAAMKPSAFLINLARVLSRHLPPRRAATVLTRQCDLQPAVANSGCLLGPTRTSRKPVDATKIAATAFRYADHAELRGMSTQSRPRAVPSPTCR